ncbi:MAG: DUF4373 domain-containing protein [Ruminococcus sp.]
MSRPTKIGLDYFPLDVELDENIKLIEAEFGLKGFAIIVKIYSKIYKYLGYYGEFDQKKTLLFAKDVCADVSLVNEIIGRALEYGIFDKGLYDNYKVLTSRGIQKRYIEIISRRKNISLKNEYLLIPRDAIPSYINVDDNSKYADINSKNVDTNATKEIKKNKTKLNKSRDNIDTLKVDYKQVLELFGKICKSLPKPRELTDSRKKHIRAAVKSGVDFKSLFEMVERSDFLSGRSGRWNGCSFDWVLNVSNRTKILEGNYENKHISLSKPFYGGKASYNIEDLERIE